MARPIPRTKSNLWWNRRWPYRIFLLRELSAVSLAIYIVLLLVLVDRVRDGAGFNDWLDVLKNPLMIALHVVFLFFALLHTVTWFQAVPRATVVKLGGQRVPDMQVVAGVYALWAAVSIVVLAIFLIV